MTWVRAVYKIPELKHIFLVVTNLDDKNYLSKDTEKKKKYFERVLQNKYSESKKKYLEWKIKPILEKDFLEIIEEHTGKMIGSTNPNIENSEEMELLSINLKTSTSLLGTFSICTSKILNKVSNDDIIEVFV